MSPYDLKIKEYLNDAKINAEHLILNESCHSVEEAAKAVHACKEEFVKNICMIDQNENLIVAIVKGEDRASTSRVSKILNIARPRLATETEVLERTGYPAGGVPSFSYCAKFLIDPRVTEMTYVFTGGGSPTQNIRLFVM
nr:YbaK/EbsC family protein [uncultured Bacillus sp.]